MHEQKILAVLKELQKNVEELLRLNRLMHTVEKEGLKEQPVTEVTPLAQSDTKQQRLPEKSKKEGKEITGREKSKGAHR